MLSPTALLTGFVLEKIEGEPLARRAQLYRALAAMSALPFEKTALEQLAADCDAIEAAHAQLKFDFQQRNRGGRG